MFIFLPNSDQCKTDPGKLQTWTSILICGQLLIHIFCVLIRILIHCHLVFGAHEKSYRILYFWIFLTIFCFAYITYVFVVLHRIFSIFSTTKVKGNNTNLATLVLIITVCLLEVMSYIYGIVLAFMSAKEIKKEENKETY